MSGPTSSSKQPATRAGWSHRVTPVILTYNEAPNIARTLAKLQWASRIVVLDSGSEDETADICRSHDNVSFFIRKFDSHARQWTFAIEQTDISTPWILALDADYVLSDAFIAALPAAVADEALDGWKCHFNYVVFGKALSGTLYPAIIALYRNGRGRYIQDGHTHRLLVEGQVRDISGVIYHDDRKPLARWFDSQSKYAKLEADHLLSTDKSQLGLADKVRLMAWPAPLLAGFYTLFAKGVIFDGLPGWYYTLQRVLAEIILAIELIDRRLRRDDKF